MRRFLALSAGLLLTCPVLADAVDPHAGHGHPSAAPAVAGSVQGGPEAAPAVDPAKAPKIFTKRPKFDFGNVDEGPDIHHNFHISNQGRGKLIVTNVGTSCGCTAAVLKKHGTAKDSDEAATLPVTLLPGEGGSIKATYHTQGRPGHATKVITVSSNDPTNPNFQLQLDMTVLREVDVTPERVYLYSLHHKEAKASAVTLLGKPGIPLKVLSAEGINKLVTVDGIVPYTDEATKRSGAVVNFTVPVTAPIGPLNEEILIKTDHPKKPEIKVPLVGEVEGRVVLEPKSIYLQARQEVPMVVRLRVNDPKGFAIRSVRSEKHLVRPSIKKTTGPDGIDQFEMSVVTIKNVPAESDGKDRILISTNDQDQAEIAVDVTVGK